MKTFKQWADKYGLSYTERGIAEVAWKACRRNFKKQHQVRYDHCEGWEDVGPDEFKAVKDKMALPQKDGGEYYRRHYQTRIIYVEN